MPTMPRAAPRWRTIMLWYSGEGLELRAILTQLRQRCGLHTFRITWPRWTFHGDFAGCRAATRFVLFSGPTTTGFMNPSRRAGSADYRRISPDQLTVLLAEDSVDDPTPGGWRQEVMGWKGLVRNSRRRIHRLHRRGDCPHKPVMKMIGILTPALGKAGLKSRP